MTVNLDSEITPIDPEKTEYARMLANLQGNILKSHGRNFSLHLFLTFAAAPEISRRWVAGFAERFVTSAYQQHLQSKALNDVERLFGGFYLSAAGYQSLGFDDLSEFEEDNSIENNVLISFKDGMAAGFDELSDAPPDEWDAPFRDHQIHALILLADDDEEKLLEATKQIKSALEKIGAKIFVQKGAVLRDANGKPIEHFGFRDCISQPLFYQQDIEKEREKGFDRWDATAPLNLVLVKDVLSDETDAFGSYLVYRKLEQNVKAFRETERRLAGADCLNLAESDRERAGALIVGRYRNGVPLELSATGRDENLIDYNNFNFIGANDQPSVGKCPYHAHVRRMMPRGELGLSNGKFSDEELRHRIVRRGITYDDRERDADGNPLVSGDAEKDVGLLFMCFQSSIPKQFGFLQARWANTSGFLGKDEVGIDPIIGQNRDLQDFEHQKWYPQWGDGNQTPKTFEFKTFVTLKGGEYFFAPSIAFLKSLGKQSKPPA